MFNRLKQWSRFRLLGAALAIVLTITLLKPAVEGIVRTRIESAAARHGLAARIDSVHIGIWPLLRIEGLDLDLGHAAGLHAESVAATWSGHLNLAVWGATFTPPGGVTLSSSASKWRVSGLWGNDLALTLLEPYEGLRLHRQSGAAANIWSIDAQKLTLDPLFDVRLGDRALLKGGTADGHLQLQSNSGLLKFGVNVSLRNTRLGALASSQTDDTAVGEPTDVTLQFDGMWELDRGRLDIPAIHATVASAVVTGSLGLTDLKDDPTIVLELGAQQLDFARLLDTSGLGVPEGLGLNASRQHDLGVASIDLRVSGRLSVPTALAVSQNVSFKPPSTLPPGILRLRGDFPFDAIDDAHRHQLVSVSDTSPDFIALHDVPPLFIRTLLLAEDAGFYGHRGIDLRELPSAVLTNWSRGTAARGASTLSQQLAKNLFLNRDKQLGRKVQELAVTFLLESALSKNRILEIYLNIIEWGPDLRGLRNAARHYFGCEPQALTPVQMAFLVSIIPGPIKYQSALSHGTPAVGLRTLIDNLLAKLRSVDAISDEEYRQALDDPLVLMSETSRG